MAKTSAGLLVYRWREHTLEVLLVHPGGPLWRRRDAGAWSIPKGETDVADADALATARREFEEETGQAVAGPFTALQPVRQSGGKRVLAWAVQADIDADAVRSNSFSMEWPPRSGRVEEFPEVDRAQWFALEEAGRRINPAQAGLLSQLAGLLAAG